MFSSSPLKRADLANKQSAARIWDWIPGVWLLLLVSISLAPWIVKRRLGITGIRHNRGHVIAFCVTAIVFTMGAKTLRGTVFRIIGAAAIAVLLEALEVASFGNLFEWKDVRMDLIGLGCGFLVVWFLRVATEFRGRAS